jgi:GTPase
VPKLAAERDKDGHIEYKLKLIDPTPERFERLVTQMMWRLKQGRNEAIYEIGLAGEWYLRSGPFLDESADHRRRRHGDWTHPT